MSWFDTFYVFASIILMLIFLAAIPLGIIIDPNLFGFMGVWAVYNILSCFTATSAYINNLVQFSEMIKNIEAAISSPPTMHMSVQNYHYKTKYKASRKTFVRERVNTTTNFHDFKGHWVDQSSDPSTLNYLHVMWITRLHTTASIILSPTVKKRFKAEKKEFIKNNSTDSFFEFSYR